MAGCSHPVKEGGHIARDVRDLFGLATKEKHEREGRIAQRKKVHQGVLMDPVGFAQSTADPVSQHGRASFSGGEPHENGRCLFGAGYFTEKGAQCSGGSGLHALSSKKGPDVSAQAQAVGAGEPITASRPIRGDRQAHFPGRVSLTESTLRPLLRRRASTARPFLVAIRARNPWVRARLTRLG